MINKQMKELIDAIKTADMNNHVLIHNLWDKEIEVLSFSLDETIKYLKQASEEEIYWCSEVWDDISSHFKSKELIDTMIECKNKYPNIAKDLDVDIKYAVEAMK